MKILAFDTSNAKCCVAIADGDRILATANASKTNQQAEVLLLLIQEVLSKAQFSYQDLDFLAVTTGPGSFTGVRIGLAAAEGIIMGSNIVPIGINSLEAINFRVLEHARNFDRSIVLMNAFRSQLYIQSFDSAGAALTEPDIIENGNLMDYLSGFKERLALIGSGIEFVDKSFDAIMLPRFPLPNARILARLSYNKIIQNNYISDLSPVYIRLPDAKVKAS